MSEESPITGLGEVPKNEWPGATSAEMQESPIKRLVPGSELHARVLTYLLSRLDASEQKMAQFYARWRATEKRHQAYINLNDWEKALKAMNAAGEPPAVVSIVVPYSYATVNTIVTYLLHAFTARKPMMQVGSYKKETVQNAMMMELVLQYNADHSRLIRHLHQFLQDGEVYGVGVLLTRWKKVKALRTVWTDEKKYGWLNSMLGSKKISKKEMRTIYSGNDVRSIDPFMFFPDHRVPMCEVNRKGEFVFWREFIGKHLLKRDEADGLLTWIDCIGNLPTTNYMSGGGQSARALISGGDAHPGANWDYKVTGAPYAQVDQGSVEIIPAELGLGTSTRPEKWLFAIGNRKQIIQAEPLNLDHGMHPVSVAEPSSVGYGFGSPSTTDYLAPIQDTLSWLINSHMDNVRTVLNNMLVVDPSLVEMQDLKEPGAGKLIRLKPGAYGTDVRAAVQQLQVGDVTANHVKDFELFMRIGDAMTGVNDNLRGTLDPGGRKTATESRTTNEAAGSRLASRARIIAAQAFVDLTEQMCLNVQQLMDDDFYMSLVGMQGINRPIHGIDGGQPGIQISPEMLVGDFYYPIQDGTLPLDRVALLDVWKEIFLAISQDEGLRQGWNLGGIFEYLAELGGAKGLERFKVDVQTAPPGVDPGAGSGMAPLPPGGQTPGVVSNPGQRLAGGL